MTTTLTYQGEELGVFAHAVRWKRYFRDRLTPFIAGDALEVGAGLGGTTRALRGVGETSWTCLEPDAELLDELRFAWDDKAEPNPPRILGGTLDDLPGDERFDTILYIDVLEHIEDDVGELRRAAARLRPGGRLVVLSPAHPWLFSPFDEAIGHWRRYTRKSLRALSPQTLTPERFFYLDSVGMLASAANRWLLRSSEPTLRQVAFWDRWMVPFSRRLDPLLFYSLGKSVVGVWSCQAAGLRRLLPPAVEHFAYNDDQRLGHFETSPDPKRQEDAVDQQCEVTLGK